MQQQPDIRFVDVMRDIWAGRKAVFIGLFVGIVLGAAFIMAATPHYKTEMIVAPASPMNGAEMSSLIADDNLFALRFMIQRVGVPGSTDFLNFENIYAGPMVAQELLRDGKIMSGLEADQSFFFTQPENNWNAAQLSEYISSRVTLSPLGTGGMRMMRYYHPDADFALYMLQQIHAVSDSLIRENIRAQAAERISYLNDAVSGTMNPEHRRALTTLLLEQERLLMLVSIDQPYAAKIIEPPASGARPAWPDKALVLCVLAVIGAFSGFVIYSLRHASSQAASLGHGNSVRVGSLYKTEPSNYKQAAKTGRAAE